MSYNPPQCSRHTTYRQQQPLNQNKVTQGKHSRNENGTVSLLLPSNRGDKAYNIPFTQSENSQYDHVCRICSRSIATENVNLDAESNSDAYPKQPCVLDLK